MKLHPVLRQLMMALCLGALSAPALATQGADMILHMLDYIRVDYPATVKNRHVIDTEEYSEMQEFSSQVLTLTRDLEAGDEKQFLIDKALQLQRAIEQRQAPLQITTLTTSLSSAIVEAYPVTISPRLPPSISSGQQLYAQQCASCHGVNGDGNGPQAVGLTPPPIDFQDMVRQKERSIWGLYSAITQGVEGTAMTGFHQLSEEQRWALAFYVSNFPFEEEQRSAGRALWENARVQGWTPNLASLTSLTPAEAKQRFGDDGMNVLAYLRSQPQALATGQNALFTAMTLLASSVEHYRDGEQKQAYQLALSAYLDGFELGEAALASSAPELSHQLEQSMLGFRERIRAGAPLAEIEQDYTALLTDLERAGSAMAENQMTASMGFVSAYVILLREGLEAILLLAAIAAVLIKLGRQDTLPYLHAGWVGALALGGVTWLVSTYLFTISGAGRELTEGLTALLACAVLLYVGFWLHDKTHADSWREFVDSKVRTALQGKRLWMLTFIAFLAVYREVFETVLFYQALWLQAAPEVHSSLWGGVVGATVSLAALGWIILRSSIRLPLNLVFRLNAVILFILAVVFAGHGVAGLQEAGWLPIDLITAPSFDLLGIYPTVETLSAQVIVVALVSLIFLRQRRRSLQAC